MFSRLLNAEYLIFHQKFKLTRLENLKMTIWIEWDKKNKGKQE